MDQLGEVVEGAEELGPLDPIECITHINFHRDKVLVPSVCPPHPTHLVNEAFHPAGDPYAKLVGEEGVWEA